MALTMVHLLCADRWAQTRPIYRDSPEYYLGAISPDAIHVRDHDDKSHKNAIHLNNWNEMHPGDIADYWRARSSPFDIGYGVHCLTDCQWVAGYRRTFPGLFGADGKLCVERYYNDTFVTDFALRDAVPRLREILLLIGKADVPADHPLLTFDEFYKWREMILAAYAGECPRQGEARFIDETYVRAFCESAMALIDQVYEEAMS